MEIVNNRFFAEDPADKLSELDDDSIDMVVTAPPSYDTYKYKGCNFDLGYVWDSFDEIDFDELPDRFVLKANHGSGWNIIVKDKAQFDREAAKEKFDTWMETNFAFCNGLELQYLNIPPKIIAEQYMGRPIRPDEVTSIL